MQNLYYGMGDRSTGYAGQYGNQMAGSLLNYGNQMGNNAWRYGDPMSQNAMYNGQNNAMLYSGLGAMSPQIMDIINRILQGQGGGGSYYGGGQNPGYAGYGGVSA
jgi:hypothetical protein